MVENDMTDEQVSLVLDFLKRWGIDSPELVYELTDHYCELAKDRMAEGLSFETVLDSWKSKKHFRELKLIQSEYEQAFKKNWLKAHFFAIKKIFLSIQIIYLFITSGIILGAYHLGFGGYITLLFVLLSFTICGAYFYFYYSDKYMWLFKLRDSMMIWFGNYIIVMQFYVNDGFTSIWHGRLIEVNPTLIIVGVILSVASYNLVKTAWDQVKMITDEYLSEPKKFQNR